MFNIDKEKLKAHLRDYTSRPWPNTHALNSMEANVREIARYEASLIIQNVIDELVDSLYSISEFERDIGLKSE